MPNEQNLIPFNQRPESEQRAIRLAGGYASGVARRRKKALREAADLFLSLPVKDQRIRRSLQTAGVDENDIDNQMAVIAGLVKEARAGNPRAAKVIFDLLGEDAGPARDTQTDDALSQSLEAMAQELTSDDQS